MTDYELWAHFIAFAQFDNGGLEWDFDRWTFIERR